MRVPAADLQRRYAVDNDEIANRLDEAGHGEIAAVYRDTALRHRKAAAELDRIVRDGGPKVEQDLSRIATYKHRES